MPNPNQAENRDPAEGSRETAQANGDEVGGISNRPKSEEQASQDRDEGNTDPVMPADDSSLRTNI